MTPSRAWKNQDDSPSPFGTRGTRPHSSSGKIYEVFADANAESHAMIRVIDEEYEDYLYPASWSVPIELPAKVEQAILELVDH